LCPTAVSEQGATLPRMTDSEALLPAMTREEKVLETVGTVAGLVPVLGGPVSSILLGVSGDRRFGRVHACLVELSERIGHLDEEQEAFVRSEDFEPLIEATQRVWGERNGEKRRAYRDFLLDAITHPTAEPYDERPRLLRVIEQVQEVHIEVLRAALQDPDPNSTPYAGSMSAVLLQRLGWGDDQSARGRLTDLMQQMGDLRIVNAAPVNTMMTGAGAQNTPSILTPLGQRFMHYLEADE
jgi:hypothetical protein